MTIRYVKTTYNAYHPNGLVKEKTLYIEYNVDDEVTSFYAEDGSFIMAVKDTIDNHLLEAINRGYNSTGINRDSDYVRLCSESEFKNKILKGRDKP